MNQPEPVCPECGGPGFYTRSTKEIVCLQKGAIMAAGPVHVERPTRMKDGRTYCACGSPWPCPRRDVRVADMPEVGLMLPVCCDTEAWRFTDPTTREPMVRVLHDEECPTGGSTETADKQPTDPAQEPS